LRFEKNDGKKGARGCRRSAQEVAARHENQQIEPIHLLAALVVQGRRRGAAASRAGWESAAKALSEEIETRDWPLAEGAGFLPSSTWGRPLNEVAGARVLIKRRTASKDEYMFRRRHLFSGDRGGGTAIPRGNCLKRQGAFPRSHTSGFGRGCVERRRVTSQNPEATYASAGKNMRATLTELARKSKLDPVIGRDEEIRRVMQILGAGETKKQSSADRRARRREKTAIVEGLAQRIVSGDVAGPSSRPRGSSPWTWRPWWPARNSAAKFEDRLKAVLKEITEAEGANHPVHRRVAHAGSARAPRKARWTPPTCLKPALARGELRAIGATNAQRIQEAHRKRSSAGSAGSSRYSSSEPHRRRTPSRFCAD